MPELREVLPKYLQIAGYIRDQIVRGDLKPGDEVPSERALAVEWKVARPTATKALETLRVQGLIESRQGAGTYVRGTGTVPRARERFARAREHGTMYSDAEVVEFLATEIVDHPPEYVLHALRLPAGSPAVRRARLISRVDAGPVEVSTSWFAPELAEQAPRLMIPERLRGGTQKYLASTTGRTARYARDQVSAHLASQAEADHLRLEVPAAVLVYHLTAYDAEDVPVQFDEAVYPPDRWVFPQEYPLDL